MVDPLIGKLIQLLHHHDPLVRRNAAGALRLHGRRAAAAISEIAKLTTDEDAEVRAEACQAIARLRHCAA